MNEDILALATQIYPTKFPTTEELVKNFLNNSKLNFPLSELGITDNNTISQVQETSSASSEGTAKVDKATSQGLEQKEVQSNFQPNTPNSFEGAVAFNPITTYLINDFGNDLLQQKRTYENAEKESQALAKLLGNPETLEAKGLTADQVQEQMETLGAAMKRASDKANAIRDTVNSKNVGLGASFETLFDNKNADQVDDTLYAIRKNAINAILDNDQYRKSSDDVYEENFLNYRRQGKSERTAAILAGEKAREFRANKIAFYEQARNSFGFNGDNQLNRFGEQFQNYIEQERPSAADYRNTLATPAQQFANDFTLENNAIQQAYTQDNLRLAHSLNMTMEQFKQFQENLRVGMSLENAWKIAVLNDTGATSRTKMNNEAQKDIAAGNNATQVLVAKLSKTGVNDPDKLKDKEVAANYVKKNLGTITYYLKNGNKDEALNAISNFKEVLNDNTFKSNQYIGGSEINRILNKIDLLEKAANGDLAALQKVLDINSSSVSSADLGKINYNTGQSKGTTQKNTPQNQTKQDLNEQAEEWFRRQ